MYYRAAGQKMFRRTILALAFVVSVSGVGFHARAQEYREVTSKIPRESFKSWSLLLISNPEWVLPQSNDKLKQLYLQFKAFGGAIGPSHVAVWFATGKPSENELYNSVDVVRSSAFCERLKLPPSQGPYLLVTTDYPGEGDLGHYPSTFLDTLYNYNVIALNGAEPAQIARLLNHLADTLLVSGIVKLDSHTEGYWRTWERTFESMRKFLVGVSSKITFKIKTEFFETDIKF
jgi:hypothetical protein